MSTVSQINIPVKPYIAKYITAIYGSPIKVGLNTMPGKLIYACLQKKPQNYNVKKEEWLSIKMAKLTATIPFLLKEQYVNYPGKYITDHKKKLLNDLFEDYFNDHICYYLMAQKQVKNRKIQTEIKNFCKQHNIVLNKDIMMDAILKTLARRSLQK